MCIHEMEILIECKRLVEKMLYEKKRILEHLCKNGQVNSHGARAAREQIARMECALKGQPLSTSYDQFEREEVC